MPRKPKTGTVTGANLDKPNRGKKGGLTGSTRVTGEDVETTFVPATTFVSDTPAIPAVLPTSDPEVSQTDASARANLVDKLKQAGNVVGSVVNAANTALQQGTTDPSALTDGTVNTAAILTKADATINESVPELDSAEATRRNIVIARQRNFVSVAISNTRLNQDLATLDNEQQKLIGMLIDVKTTGINNQTKAVGYNRAVVSRDTELSRLEQDQELLTQQRIRTQGTQSQTELIQEQENLKVEKLREQNEKTKYEIENISYEKEAIKQQAVAKFAAGF